MRSDSSEQQQRAQSALLAIRARAVEHPRFGAKALVVNVTRMLEEENWPPRATAILELFIAWFEGAASVPDPQVRELVARQCVRLAKRLTGPLKDRLFKTLGRLQKDARIRVRKAAEGWEE